MFPRKESIVHGAHFRKFFRANVILKVHYKTQENSPREGTVLSKNLSAGGISIIVPVVLQEGMQVELSLFVPEVAQPIHATGKIIWQSVCSSGQKNKAYYSTGIEFVGLLEKDELVIAQFVHQILKEQSEKENRNIIAMIERLQ